MRFNTPEEQHEIAAATTINPEDLQSSFVRLPADVARWNALFAIALDAELRADTALKKVTAYTAMTIRKDREASGQKTTEAIVESLTYLEPAWEQAKLAAIDAEADRVMCRGVIDAIHATRDSLISLGARQRAELESELTMREQSQFRRRQAEAG